MPEQSREHAPPEALRRGRGIVVRPPSSAVWVLYQNMQRVWWGLFTTATVGFVAALSLMAVVFLRGHVHPSPAWLGWAGFGVILVAGLCYWFRPVLGSED
ncbi:hypothetical protein [Nonomuraea sp. NPDC050540]|uniref:hypothetical protein n=1 Tax=Nonomuraea sp. NPDC050540 TaxID=3364367 RepID=UPI0037A40FAC